MTSPRQRKKRLALKKMKEKLEERSTVVDHKPIVVEKQVLQQEQEAQKSVAQPTQRMLESETVVRHKKSKNGLFELKSQVQNVEQPKEEVNSKTLEDKQQSQTKE